MPKPIYILGTGLSHNGSAVLLKDGAVCVAIEKERITRIKHDGGNDADAINYCLEAAGIRLEDIALVVQCANFERPARDRFHGKRLFAEAGSPPVIDISHHLAHAYSAAGTCPFDACAIMVIDGSGSPYEQCSDLSSESDCLYDPDKEQLGMYCEKDSFYYFDGQHVISLVKDFSPVLKVKDDKVSMPVTRHSIGGFYAAISHYVFGSMDDVGKLMGLAPYGIPETTEKEVFYMENGRLFLTEDWNQELDRPSSGYDQFKQDFQYYANIAWWAQNQVEKAVVSLFRHRLSIHPHLHVAYSGGVALNAVANTRLLELGIVQELYMEPAAGDNGLALGCAFYGWLEIMGKKKRDHSGNTCFGKNYTEEEITSALEQLNGNYTVTKFKGNELLEAVSNNLKAGKTIGWFQDGAEFGPRALGHRSILAHPGIPGIGDHINAHIKFREDFRPFAPAILKEYAPDYFLSGRESPYMILIDHTKGQFKGILQNVTHVNGTARVQTIEPEWNPLFYHLVKRFYEKTGIPVLLNTSLNRKGEPMVETPSDALKLFLESALDVLVIDDYFISKER